MGKPPLTPETTGSHRKITSNLRLARNLPLNHLWRRNCWKPTKATLTSETTGKTLLPLENWRFSQNCKSTTVDVKNYLSLSLPKPLRFGPKTADQTIDVGNSLTRYCWPIFITSVIAENFQIWCCLRENINYTLLYLETIKHTPIVPTIIKYTHVAHKNIIYNPIVLGNIRLAM